MVKIKACVFISGQGSNLRNLIFHSREKNFPIKICLIISSKKDAYGIIYARKYGIPYKIIDTNTKNHTNEILYFLRKYKISFICLAGYMKIISKKIISCYENKIINIHPSLLPKFKGLNTFSRVLKNNEKKTGCTVHYVDSKLDNGRIITKKSFYLNKFDNEESLKLKTQQLEYKAYPEAIIKIFKNR